MKWILAIVAALSATIAPAQHFQNLKTTTLTWSNGSALTIQMAGLDLILAPRLAVLDNGPVPAQGPVAEFLVYTSTNIVVVEAGLSHDPRGRLLKAWTWVWGDGLSETGFNYPQAEKRSHVYGRMGTFNITLIVTDADGNTATNIRPVTLTAPRVAAPSCIYAKTPEDQQHQERTIVVEESGFSSPFVFSWVTWGDGSPLTLGVPAAHTFAGPGFYMVTYHIQTAAGTHNRYAFPVTILP